MDNRIPGFDELLNVSAALGTNSEAPKLWNGLVGWWPVQEGEGQTVYDLSGCGRDASFHTDSAAVAWVTGKYGYAGRIDREADHNSVWIPTSIDFANLSVFMVWKPTATVYGAFQTLSTATYPFCVGVEGTPKRWRCTNTTGARRWYGPSQDEPTGAYYSVGAYRTVGTSATSCGVYENGQSLAMTTDATDEADWTDSAGGAPGFGLGYVTAASWTDADVALCAAWDRVLTDSEFGALHIDPWAMGRLRRRVFAATSGGAANALPMASDYYRMMTA